MDNYTYNPNSKRRFPPEVRERAVRLFREALPSHPTKWSAIKSIASKIGCSPETLRGWVRQADIDDLVKVLALHLTSVALLGGSMPLDSWWGGCLLNLCVSDHHKTLLLRNPDLMPHLLSGLFLGLRSHFAHRRERVSIKHHGASKSEVEGGKLDHIGQLTSLAEPSKEHF